MSQNPLPYAICDADNHFSEPPDCFERYIDPSKRDLAIRFVTAADGQRANLSAFRIILLRAGANLVQSVVTGQLITKQG